MGFIEKRGRLVLGDAVVNFHSKVGYHKCKAPIFHHKSIENLPA